MSSTGAAGDDADVDASSLSSNSSDEELPARPPFLEAHNLTPFFLWLLSESGGTRTRQEALSTCVVVAAFKKYHHLSGSSSQQPVQVVDRAAATPAHFDRFLAAPCMETKEVHHVCAPFQHPN